MTIQETNVVTPLRPAKAKRADNTAALRQRRSRAKRKLERTVAATTIAQVTHPGKPSGIKADVTVARGETPAVTAPSGRTNYALVIIAYGFFMLGIGINIWNATTGGTLADLALPAAQGVLAEAVVFFLPAWALTLPIGRQVLAWALFAFYRSSPSRTACGWPASLRPIRRPLEANGRRRGCGRQTTRWMSPGRGGTMLAAPVTASRLPARSVRRRLPSWKPPKSKPRTR
jgi:hypothetical protein